MRKKKSWFSEVMLLCLIAQGDTKNIIMSHEVWHDDVFFSLAYSSVIFLQLYGEGSKKAETRACPLVLLMTEVRW